MLEMEPGRDGKPWRLCRTCWSNGIAPIEYATEQSQDEQGSPSELPLEHAYARVVVKRAGGSR